MKKLTLIVHADIQQALADALRALPDATGFTFTPVEGHGPQAAQDPSLSAHDRVVGYVPQVRVDLVLDDTAVDVVLDALRKSSCGVSGRGMYWITRLDRHGRL